MRGSALAFLILLVLPAQVVAQGFDGLSASGEGFAQPSRDTRLSFPDDHGPHQDFRVEWWYITANLTGSDGKDYGAQWTLFRSSLDPGKGTGFQSPVIWLAHAALTTPEAHFAAERYARGGVGQAGVTGEPFAAWLDDWSLSGRSLGDVRMSVQASDFSYDISLEATGPYVLQGDKGYSVKSAEGDASHYYSQPFYEASGVIETADGPVTVTGQAWLDREWFSSILTGGQPGWDWTALHLDDGAKLMAFQVRRADGGADSAATWIAPDGTTTQIDLGAVTFTPLGTTRVAGRDVPTSWRVVIPERALDVTIEAINPLAWNDLSVPYWEGPVRATGSHQGRGYLEMTGYE